MYRKFTLCFIIINCVILFAACSAYFYKTNGEYWSAGGYNNQESLLTINKTEYGEMEIVVFNIGKADAIIITTENHAIMIDTGEEKHSGEILDHLVETGVDTIDYLIITHFDKDHVGGAGKIINNLEVREVIVPNYRRDTKHYTRFSEAMRDKGIIPVVLARYNKLEFIDDGVLFATYPSELDYYEYHIENNNNEDADEEYYDEDDDDNETPNVNNFSLVTSVSHGGNNFLFTGDAKSGRIKEILSVSDITDISYDFLKVPHHGRYNKRIEDFILNISPKYAVITCSPDKPPDDEVSGALEAVGTEVFLTYNGIVHCISDGNTLRIQQYLR